jgi:hypothetical protein
MRAFVFSAVLAMSGAAIRAMPLRENRRLGGVHVARVREMIPRGVEGSGPGSEKSCYQRRGGDYRRVREAGRELEAVLDVDSLGYAVRAPSGAIVGGIDTRYFRLSGKDSVWMIRSLKEHRSVVVFVDASTESPIGEYRAHTLRSGPATRGRRAR